MQSLKLFYLSHPPYNKGLSWATCTHPLLLNFDFATVTKELHNKDGVSFIPQKKSAKKAARLRHLISHDVSFHKIQSCRCGDNKRGISV